MKMMNKINTFNSQTIDNLLKDIDPKLEKQVEIRMKLAAKIDNARIRMGLSKKQFAEQMSKQPSEISKWLSGTHNFTIDTLFEIQEFLNIKLLNIDDEPNDQVFQFLFEATQKDEWNQFNYLNFNFLERFKLNLGNDITDSGSPFLEFLKKQYEHEKKHQKGRP